MASYRCGLCGIHYPQEYRFMRCPVHGTNSAPMRKDPDEDWQWRATAIMTGVENAAKAIDGDIPILPVIVTEKDGGYWVSSHAIQALGFRRGLKTFDVIEIPRRGDRPEDWPCDCLWEVMGYRNSTREYWIYPLRVPDTLGTD